MIKRIVFAVALGCVLVVPVQAFEKVGSTAVAKSVGSDAVAQRLSEKGAIKKDTTGGGLVLPGLGALGVLPKLDFGLELLYGENEPQVFEPEQDEMNNDGLQIKGTLKHRF